MILKFFEKKSIQKPGNLPVRISGVKFRGMFFLKKRIGRLEQRLKWSLLGAALVPVAVLGSMSFFGVRHVLRQQIIEKKTLLIERSIVEIQTTLEEFIRQARRGAKNSVVKKLAEAQSMPPGREKDKLTKQWQRHLRGIFRSIADATPEISQIRYIDENGWEMVRVDSDGKNVHATTEFRNESSQYYFREAIKRQADEVYLSRFDLSVERGKPQSPMIRYAAPVFDEISGERRGVFVLNVRMSRILKALDSKIDPKQNQTLFLTDEAGYFLYHPDPKKRFSWQLKTGYNFFDEFPRGKNTIQHNSDKLSSHFSGKNWFFHRKIKYAPSQPNEFWHLFLVIPKKSLFAPISRFEQQVLIVLVAVIFAVFIFAWITGRSIASPIRRLEQVATQLPRNLQIPIPKNLRERKDEIGDLVRTFQVMAKKLLNFRRTLESKVADRTQELEKFQLAVENISEIVIFADASGRILYANRAVEKMTGFSREEILGKKCGGRELWGGAMGSGFYKKMWKMIKCKKSQFFSEIQNRRKDGTLYFSELSVTPILDDDGKIQFFVAVERDITERTEIDRMKNEFVSVASHQLRTPLSAIRWVIESLIDGDSGKITKKVRNSLEKIANSNHRMIELVNDLLQVSKIEAKTLKVQLENVNLSELTRATLAEFSPLLDEKSIEIDFLGDSGVILTDKNLIAPVLQNLISNAIKYTLKNGKIKIVVKKMDKFWKVEIADTGIGIPKSEQGQIFDKFFRASNVSRAETDGSGLGMYIAKSMIELLGGKIGFDSAEDGGATFWFLLPNSQSKK